VSYFVVVYIDIVPIAPLVEHCSSKVMGWMNSQKTQPDNMHTLKALQLALGDVAPAK